MHAVQPLKKFAMVLLSAITINLQLVNEIDFGDPLVFFQDKCIKLQVRCHRVIGFYNEIFVYDLFNVSNYPAGMERHKEEYT
jgi:hypothetical protein